MQICEEERSSRWRDMRSEDMPDGPSHGRKRSGWPVEDTEVERAVIVVNWVDVLSEAVADAIEKRPSFSASCRTAAGALEELRDRDFSEVCTGQSISDTGRTSGSVSAKTDIARANKLAQKNYTHHVYLDRIYDLSQADMVHAAGDIIFDLVQGLLKAGEFSACDRVLSTVDISRLKPALMITFLATTLAARDRLRARSEYYSRVLAHLTAERGQERATRLLDKYR